MKVYKKDNVFVAAQKRVSMLFDEFDCVMAASSGGKDSTVVVELAVAEARRRDRLPLKVVFIDQEAEWQGTVEYMEWLMDRSEIELWWFQVPFKLENSASYEESWLHCWDEGNPEKWLRPKHPKAFAENRFMTDRFYPLFDKVYPVAAGQKRFAVVYGLRAAESPQRAATMCLRPVYKNITWSSIAGKTGFKFGIIYDWSTPDVWTAIAREGWRYNSVYDKQFWWGVSVHKMRVSSLVHMLSAIHSLQMLQEIEPDTYEALVQRLPGIDTYGKLGKDVALSKLPAAYATWEEYSADLTQKLLSEEGQVMFENQVRKAMKAGVVDEEFWKSVAHSAQLNDLHGTNFEQARSARGVRDYKRSRKYASD